MIYAVESSVDIKIIGGLNIYEIVYPIDERLLKIISEFLSSVINIQQMRAN